MREFFQRFAGTSIQSRDTTTHLYIFTGEKPRYRPVQTLDGLGKTLELMGCEKITKVFDEKGINCVEWTVDKERKTFGVIGYEGPITPSTIVFTYDEKGVMCYRLKLGDTDFTTDSQNQVPNTLGWSGNSGQKFSTTRATNFFLHSFAEEPHAVLARTDPFGFQFYTGMNTGDKDVRVTIAGVKFTFRPTNRKNSTVSGKVTVEVPQ